MRYVAWGLLALTVLALPLASACADAGGPLAPGDQIQIADHLCSLAFVLVDENGIYFATAGHCVQVDQKVTDKNGKLVGTGAFHYLNPETGSESDGSPGEDFALIRVDPSIYDHITPAVCGWGGPVGLYEEKPGSGGVKHYGHGIVTGDVSPQRQGVNLENDNKAFYWLGAGTPGDSGSGVMSDDLRALGVLTHLGAFGASDNGGTHLDRGMQLAADKGGFTHLRLVLAKEDPVALYREMQANASKGPAPTPVTLASNGNTPTGSGNATTSNGTAPTAPPSSTSNGTGQPETPGALQTQPDAQSAKKAPGPEAAIVLAGILALAVGRRARR